VFNALGLERERLLVLVHSGSRGYGESILRGHVAEHGASGCSPQSEAGQAYLRQHDVAVRWAKANRQLIGQRFLETLGGEAECIWDGCHNSISRQTARDGEVWLHRKGAVAADAEALVIPGSRGTLS